MTPRQIVQGFLDGLTDMEDGRPVVSLALLRAAREYVAAPADHPEPASCVVCGEAVETCEMAECSKADHNQGVELAGGIGWVCSEECWHRMGYFSGSGLVAEVLRAANELRDALRGIWAPFEENPAPSEDRVRRVRDAQQRMVDAVDALRIEEPVAVASAPDTPLALPEPELGEGGAPGRVTGEAPAEEPLPAAAWLIRWVPDIPRSEEVTTNPGRFVDVMENCARHGVTGERLYTGTTLGAARYDERRKRDREWCAAIVATQESRDGRMVCDVEILLRRFNLSRPEEPTP